VSIYIQKRKLVRDAGAERGDSVPLLDVVMPVFNCEHTVSAAVASIQAQTVTNFRLVIVDDGSCDRTGRIIESAALADPRIIVIRQVNQGIVSALNRGLSASSAPLVARHDGDDLALPDRFAQQIDHLRRFPDCVAVGGRVAHIGVDGSELGTESEPLNLSRVSDRVFPAVEPYLIHPTLMVRRSALKLVGSYRGPPLAEDTDLYWRLAAIGDLHELPEVVAKYRVHGNSLSGRSIVNGRIQAFGSQLAALASIRRREARGDIELPEPENVLAEATRSLESLIRLATVTLHRDEEGHLRLAVAAKLLELTSYRPYELDLSDCQFISGAVLDWMHLADDANARAIRNACSGAAARLAAAGRFRAARDLVPKKMLCQTLLRMTMRFALPRKIRRAVNRARGRTLPLK
jgi:glycosyltransferase involved in cell wall biosynthesis